ncbi:hypothetical protein [Pseudorhodobacter turbinis]|nr:hypothetical protein [Pseudorhodobacter turbinis]
MRGFGSIHYRNKSGNGFIGENYYSDCENLIKYPSQTFVSALDQSERPILAYPIYRRFFFDGQMSGRFEFGFRLNEPSIYDVAQTSKYKGLAYSYSAEKVISQLLEKDVSINLPDGRIEDCVLFRASNALRDSYLSSSTKSSMINQYDIASVGVDYVSVGSPYAFLRSGNEAPLSFSKSCRPLYSGDYEFLGSRSGLQGREIDATIIMSKLSMNEESAEERFVRLFYTQLRALAFGHSFYTRQIDSKKFSGSSPLMLSTAAMIDRLSNLIPIEGSDRDAELCQTLKTIVANSDIDPSRMASEIERRLKKTMLSRFGSWLFRNIDRKSDVAIEAAASTLTKHVLTGGL